MMHHAGLSRHETGMTLIELVVGLTVFSLVMLVTGELYLAALRLSTRGREISELVDASIAMETLTRDLRQASRGHDGIIIWRQETGGIRHDAVGVFMLGALSEGEIPQAVGRAAGSRWTGWSYFYHDHARGELRRLDQVGEYPAASPPLQGGQMLTQGVRSFSITQAGALLTVELVVVKGGQTLRLQTEIWPRSMW